MRAIPNYISVSRMILSLVLAFVKPLGGAFYTIYILCGVSDMMDGFIARKTGTTSKLGEKLDSIADLVMVGVLFFVLYPIIDLTPGIVIWIISIGIIRAVSMVVALKKYKTFASLHTYGNKITGMALFVFAILLPYIDTTVLVYIICGIATIAAIEELMIHLVSSQLQVNRKSIFE